MIDILNYFQALQTGRLSNIPYANKKCKYTILFVLPVVGTSEGLYKMIIPGFALNRLTLDVRCLLLGMRFFDGKSVNDYDYNLTAEILKQVDHVVFPFVSYDLSPVLSECRAHNKSIKFSYHVDFNYYSVPETWLFAKQYKEKYHFEAIEKNIKNVNQVIVSNRLLADHIDKNLGIKPKFQPLFFDKRYIYNNQESKYFVKSDKFRIGIIAPPGHLNDLLYLKGVLSEFMKRNETVQLVVIGTDGMHAGKNMLKDLEFQHIPFIHPLRYYQALLDLNLNVCVLPAKDNLFNRTSRNYIKIMELISIDILPVVSNIIPYTDVCIHNETAILFKDKEQCINELQILVDDVYKKGSIMNMAFSYARNFDVSIENNLNVIQKLYLI